MPEERDGHGGNTGFVKELFARYSQDGVPLAGAAVAFFLLLSLVPLLLLLITGVAFVLARRPEDAQALVGNLSETLGPGVERAVQTQLFAVVDNMGVLTGLAVLLGLWSGSQVFVFTELAINHIWRVKRKRSFFASRGIAILMTIVLGVLTAIAIGLSYLIHLLTGSTISVGGWQLPSLSWLTGILLSIVLPWLLVSVVFLLIYRFVPACTVEWRSLIPGAVVAGALWVIVLQLFSLYTLRANYSLLYGSLAGLVVLMIWFYYSSQIMLLGAEIAITFHRRLIRAGRVKQSWVEEDT
ncbi:MAG: YihY/virulence factor BrkB family protein [Armatimonadota bacterium]